MIENGSRTRWTEGCWRSASMSSRSWARGRRRRSRERYWRAGWKINPTSLFFYLMLAIVNYFDNSLNMNYLFSLLCNEHEGDIGGVLVDPPSPLVDNYFNSFNNTLVGHGGNSPFHFIAVSLLIYRLRNRKTKSKYKPFPPLTYECS